MYLFLSPSIIYSLCLRTIFPSTQLFPVFITIFHIQSIHQDHFPSTELHRAAITIFHIQSTCRDNFPSVDLHPSSRTRVQQWPQDHHRHLQEPLVGGGGCTLPSGQHYGLWILFLSKWVMRLCCWVFQMSFEQHRVWEHKADNWHQSQWHYGTVVFICVCFLTPMCCPTLPF